ncbi:TPA: hypothetical protein QDE50_30655 [Burkholderia cenocepacia]|nr:hypothetical protein [Burkholderia cenocepacia]HDR9888553.1 hypothetical protein [Burkholderia cenocepacia]
MSSFLDVNHFSRRLPSITAAYLGAAILAACLVSACGGDDGPAASTSSAAAPAPLPPQTTSATTPSLPSLAPLAADQPYVDNTAYDTTATGSLPSATEAAAVTHHRITLNGKPLTYTATAGHLTVRDPNTNAPTASIFYTAYTLDGADVAKRPITFFFNGGPGSSSNFLHMGSYGPMRVFSEQGSTVSGPNDVTLGENPQTLLDKTDIVFVDPPGTGYSEAISPKKNQDFWGVDADELVNAGLIYRYLNINNRGQSPLMIYGESYGGPRVGIMSYTLHNTYGIKLSGLIMQAPALNEYERRTNMYSDGSVHPSRRYPVPSLIGPTITMAAKYWGAITDPTLSGLSLSDLFQKSEDFSFNTLVKLADPLNSTTGLPDPSWRSSAGAVTQAQAIAPQLNALFGNLLYADASGSQYYFNAQAQSTPSNPTVMTDTFLFANEFFGPQIPRRFVKAFVQGKTLGEYDLRKALAGENIPASIDNYLTYDPSLDDLSAYTPIFMSYVYNILKYQTVSGYQGLNAATGNNWNHNTSYPDGSQLPFPDATIFIADEMAINPKMQVMTAAGYYDGVVPAALVDWDMQYVSDPKGGQIPSSQMQSSYTRVLYPGGHMAYADDTSRQQMHDTLVGFYAKATTSSIPSLSR